MRHFAQRVSIERFFTDRCGRGGTLLLVHVKEAGARFKLTNEQQFPFPFKPSVLIKV